MTIDLAIFFIELLYYFIGIIFENLRMILILKQERPDSCQIIGGIHTGRGVICLNGVIGRENPRTVRFPMSKFS